MLRLFPLPLNPQRITRRSLTLSFCGLIAVGVFLLWQSEASSQADLRERIVDDKYSYRDCPIKLISLETGKRKVVLGKPFSDDDDWMKGLKFLIKNASGKLVTHVGIHMVIERPADRADQAPAGWDLWYGESPFSFKPDEPIAPPLLRLIQPGETETVALSDSDYDAMKAFLKDLKFPASIEKIHVSVYTIGFTHGTAWGGQLYRRDPRSKHGWTPADKPKGSARNRTAFSYRSLPISHSEASQLDWK